MHKYDQSKKHQNLDSSSEEDNVLEIPNKPQILQQEKINQAYNYTALAQQSDSEPDLNINKTPETSDISGNKEEIYIYNYLNYKIQVKHQTIQQCIIQNL